MTPMTCYGIHFSWNGRFGIHKKLTLENVLSNTTLIIYSLGGIYSQEKKYSVLVQVLVPFAEFYVDFQGLSKMVETAMHENGI
jgi:hypothetical protein